MRCSAWPLTHPLGHTAISDAPPSMANSPTAKLAALVTRQTLSCQHSASKSSRDIHGFTASPENRFTSVAYNIG
jgi:hypothetical protein